MIGPYTRPLTVIWTNIGLVMVIINPLMKTCHLTRPFEESLIRSLYLNLKICLQILMHEDRQRNDNSTHPWRTFCQICCRHFRPSDCFALICRLSVFIFFVREQSSQVTRFQGSTAILENESTKIGGEGKTVEIDESKFGKRKFHKEEELTECGFWRNRAGNKTFL